MTKPVKDKRFCFVCIDADIYRSTKECMQFFYKRMFPGVVMVFDDWEWKKWPGVKKALLESLHDKGEDAIKTADYQAIIIKYWESCMYKYEF